MVGGDVPLPNVRIYDLGEGEGIVPLPNVHIYDIGEGK